MAYALPLVCLDSALTALELPELTTKKYRCLDPTLRETDVINWSEFSLGIRLVKSSQIIFFPIFFIVVKYK